MTEMGDGGTSSGRFRRIPRTGLLEFLDGLSSRLIVRRLVYALSLGFFFVLILSPPILGIFLRLDHLGQIYSDPALMARARSAVSWSFITAFTVSILDLLAGVPLAWFIVRSRSRWINVVDSLADVPFIVPTAALGYSSLLFWSRPGGLSSLFGAGTLVSPGFLLVALLHFAFSFPVVVRVMVGALLGYKEVYEVAAKTLGAHPFTAVRTVTLPMLKPALVASFLLAFARSLSETGATVMVAGAFENGPVFIRNAKAEGLEGPLVFVSFILIFSSILVFAVIRVLGPRLRLPIRRVWPEFERRLSVPLSLKARDGVTMFVFLFFVMAPSLFICLPMASALFDGTLESALTGAGPWGGFWQSMSLSYTIGAVATLTNIVAGLPVAILIARGKLGRATTILDMLVNVPIVVPSVALGVSLSYFWETLGALPELWVLVLSHTTITYTYFVRAMSAAIEGVSVEMEEAASTLGGRPLTVFRRITLPLTKYSVFSGAILVFTRSVDETGAAIAVSRRLKTAPVRLVGWLGQVSASEQALGIGFLVLTSFISLLVARLIVRGRG